MEYPESQGQAEEYARTAMGLMARYGIAPNPRNYAVWYGFVCRRFPQLRHELEEHLAAQRPFTEDFNAALFERHFGVHDDAETVTNASLKLEATLEQMIQMIATASSGTEAYSETLESFSEQVSAGAADPRDLGSLVATVVAETRRVLKTNAKMGEELNRSSGEIHKLREDLERVRVEALTDGLTGIANRKVFDTRIREHTQTADADKSFLSLMMLDIDHFKKFNDTFGHPAGDQVLKLVANMIHQGVKGKDIAARYGGEEFAVILPHTRVRDAVSVAEAIRRAVGSKRVTNRRSGDDLGVVTLSIGVSEYRHGESIAQFIQRADEALYLAKHEGRNRVISQLELELRRMSGLQNAS